MEPGPSRSTSTKSVALIAIVALLAGLIGAGIGSTFGRGASSRAAEFTVPTTPSTDTPSSSSSNSGTTPDNGSSPTPALPSPRTAPRTTPGGSASASSIAHKVDPSIVDINVTFPNGRGAGTGIILTSSGLVLTNNHVIDNATSLEVDRVTTGDSYTAKVLGYDSTDDVALLQLQNASGLPAANLANSDLLQPGTAVTALGNALGRGGTPAVAQGTITALDQSIDVTNEDGSTSQLSGLIETSARLQPGDSGGPLVDDAGTVIGMDAAASTTQRGQTTNDSYAIPINTALDVARQIQSGQSSAKIHVGDRALLGVQAQGGQSTTVASVQSGSPAAQAGIAPGDTITSIDGTQVNTVDDIIAALDTHQPGDSVTVTWTDQTGQDHSAHVQLVAGPPA